MTTSRPGGTSERQTEKQTLQPGEKDVVASGRCRDSIDHYLHCEQLWALVEEAFSIDMSSYHARFGTGGMSVAVVKRIAAIFMSYHAVKAECIDELAVARATSSFQHIRSALLARLRAFASEYA